jgi:hypothetical protein
VRFLIDECLHTSLVRVAEARGHEARHVNWIGLSGETDWNLMLRIAAEDFTFVTNAVLDQIGLEEPVNEVIEVELDEGAAVITRYELPGAET